MREPLKRATIFVDHAGDAMPVEFDWVQKWLARWEGKLRVAKYETGGWEHLWNVEGPEEAIKEIPPDLLCHSDWADPAP
ncbi:MAG TPA: hypothetical protein VGN12_08390 [Pirellulales bacterium]